MPAVAGEDVGGEHADVESNDKEDKRNDFENYVDDDEDGGETRKDDDRAFEMVTVEAGEMDDLGGEENSDADRRDVVDGKNNIGDTSCKHGENKEKILGEGFDGVDKAEGDAADAEKDEDVVLGGEETEDDVDEHEDAPDDKPDRRNAIVEAELFGVLLGGFGGCWLGGGGKVLTRVATTRSRNSSSYFFFV